MDVSTDYSAVFRMPTIRVFKQYIKLPFVMLAAIEGLLLFLSVYAGSMVRFGDIGTADVHMGEILPRALAFAVFMLVGMSSMGLYQFHQTTRLGQFLMRLLAAFGLGWLGLAMLYYTYPDLYSGRGVLLLSLLIAMIFVTIIRPLFYRMLSEAGLRQRLLIIGAGERASNMLASRQLENRRNFGIFGFVANETEDIRIPRSRLLQIPEGSLARYCLENRIEEIVLAADDRRNSYSMKDLLDCKLQGIPIVEQMTFFEREEGRVRLDFLYPGWLVFCDGCSKGLIRLATKRAFDMVASSVLLLVSLPVMLLTALAIKLEDGLKAPIFYRQRRVGERGRHFDVLKFRSMSIDAEGDGKARWARANDSRITRIGRLIRPTRIDELPQIFNVLRGEMSFVGPRPERPEFVEQLSEAIPYYDERHCVKPGITGWAQIKYPYGASVEDARCKLEYDLYYVKNHTLMLDLYILMTTAEVVLFGKGR